MTERTKTAAKFARVCRWPARLLGFLLFTFGGRG